MTQNKDDSFSAQQRRQSLFTAVKKQRGEGATGMSLMADDNDTQNFEKSLLSKPLFSVYKEHITECERVIHSYHKYRFDTFSKLLRHNHLLIARLEAESRKYPDLASHLTYQTAIDSLERTHSRLVPCVLQYCAPTPQLRPHK